MEGGPEAAQDQGGSRGLGTLPPSASSLSIAEAERLKPGPLTLAHDDVISSLGGRQGQEGRPPPHLHPSPLQLLLHLLLIQGPFPQDGRCVQLHRDVILLQWESSGQQRQVTPCPAASASLGLKGRVAPRPPAWSRAGGACLTL